MIKEVLHPHTDWLCCSWTLCWSRTHFPLEGLFSWTLCRAALLWHNCDCNVYTAGGKTCPAGFLYSCQFSLRAIWNTLWLKKKKKEKKHKTHQQGREKEAQRENGSLDLLSLLNRLCCPSGICVWQIVLLHLSLRIERDYTVHTQCIMVWK